MSQDPWPGGEDELADFVPVVVARSQEQAEAYRRLLDRHDIPAILSLPGPAGPKGSMSRGCPVLVPEVLLDDASRVIAELAAPSQDEIELVEEDEDDPADDGGEGPRRGDLDDDPEGDLGGGELGGPPF